LADYLLRQVKLEVAAEVEAAIRLNRLADLRRRGLQEVLADRWLPTTFASGALLRDSFEVRSLTWPDPTAPAVATDFHLSIDNRLHRVWTRLVRTEVRGIAGAQTSGNSTLIAVPVSPLSEYDSERLREEYAKLFADPKIAMVTIMADTYEDLVREWFRRIDPSPARLISVERHGDHEPLLIRISDPSRPEGGRPADPASTVGTESARAALSDLLPDQRIQFVGVPRT
jgi:hypothetical protein